jgi:thiol-disulfide isomerase/thioredoxin
MVATESPPTPEPPPPDAERRAVRRRSLLIGVAIGLSILSLAVLAAVLTADRDSGVDGPVDRIDLDPQANSLIPEDQSGEAVPDEPYETLAGGRGSLAAFRGKPLVVNFFASSCEPCIREMPALQNAHQRLGDQVAFVGMNVKDPEGPASDLVQRTGVTYEIARDPDGAYFAEFGAVALPTTAFVSPGGRIVKVVTGELTTEKIEQLLTEPFGG